jgi:hypothetical protein
MVSIREAFNLMQGRAIRREGAIPGDDAYWLRLNSLRNLAQLVGGDGLVKFALRVSYKLIQRNTSKRWPIRRP